MTMTTPESKLEETLIAKLDNLKYVYRPDIHDRAALEANFRQHFQALNRVQLTDGEFKRLLDEIVTPDVFTAATLLREINSFTRDDGTPLNYTLVNIKDWCKNTFEVVNQLRINTDNSFQRYDVMLLINGIPAVQIELKTLGISPRRAMRQIVDYKKDPGNGYTKTLLCFVQLFIVSNQTETYYFANNNDRHFVFDAKYLNTLYVDKNLKHHGLIQAFSRTNRVLNAAKPYGHILDFRGQQTNVDEAITLFSGARAEQAKEIWLVDKAPVVIEQLKAARRKFDDFLQSHGLEARPEAVPNLKGDDARVAFVKQFKEIQRLSTQLDQYTDLTDEQRRDIEQTLPMDDARAFRGVYLETAKSLKAKQDKVGSTPGFEDNVAETVEGEYGSDAIDQLDFEFVLFASADIDYDYIMNLIARFSGQTPAQQEMSRDQLIRLIRSDAKFMDELDEITAYVRTLETGKPLTEEEVRNGYQRFKEERHAAELATVADKHGLTNEALQEFVDAILDRMIFDGEKLTDLMEPLDLGWRERRQKELALMDDLVSLLKKRAAGRTISGLNAYEQ